jgi:hypothetical protein
VLITQPLMAADRWLPRIHPRMLKTRAIGGVSSIVSPPRATKGEPHPGRKTSMNVRTAGATSDSHKPARPMSKRDGSGDI